MDYNPFRRRSDETGAGCARDVSGMGRNPLILLVDRLLIYPLSKRVSEG